MQTCSIMCLLYTCKVFFDCLQPFKHCCLTNRKSQDWFFWSFFGGFGSFRCSVFLSRHLYFNTKSEINLRKICQFFNRLMHLFAFYTGQYYLVSLKIICSIKDVNSLRLTLNLGHQSSIKFPFVYFLYQFDIY